MKTEIDKLAAEEQQAGIERDYERAATRKPSACAWKVSSTNCATVGKPSTSWMRS